MRMEGKLQLTSKIVTILLACLTLLARQSMAFTFKSASVNVADLTINTLTTYSITLLRNYDDTLNPTNWNITNIPSTATITVIFPSQFTPTQLNAFTCASVMVNMIDVFGFTCSISGNTIVVSDVFTGNDLVSEVVVVLDNIANPSSALTTDAFICTIYTDASNDSPMASVTFSPAPMNGLTIYFKGGIVNRTSDMIVTFTTGHQIASDGIITIKFPTTLIWTRQISTNNLIPINGTLSCYGLSTQINNSTIQCKGLYSTQVVTISSLFPTIFPSNTVLSFGIMGLFAPPTTEQVDSLAVQSCDKYGNAIQLGSQFISGLVAQTLSPYNMQSSLTGAMGVNNFAGGLTFSFSLSDTISARDYFVIAFTSGTTISILTSTSTIRTQSITYSPSSLTLTIIQNTTNPNTNSGTTVTITFIRYRAPPSTKPTSPITFTILNNGFSKMIGSATITAVANNYTLGVNANSRVVNVYTSYIFTFTMSDALTGSGYFLIRLDPLLCVSTAQINTITTNLTITISGTNIKSTPSTQISATTVNGSSSYQLLLSNINASSTVPAQSVTITVNNLLNPSYVTTLTSFSLATYYSSSADLVANANYASTIRLTTGSILLDSITSTATTTYTFTVLSITAVNTNPIPANGYISIVIPAELALLVATISSVSIGTSTVSSSSTNSVSNNTILFQISTAIGSSSSIIISMSNIMSQNSTKTTSTFIISSFDSSLNPIDQSTNSLGLSIASGNNFNSLTLLRTDYTNSKATNYTISFEQIQSYTSINSVSLKLSPLLSTSALSKVFQVSEGVTTECLFQKTNSSYISITLAQSLTSTHTIIISMIGNPPSYATLTKPILVQTYNSHDSYIYSQMYTDDIINTNPSNLIFNSYQFSSYVYEQPTNLSLSVTGLSDWPSLTHQLIIDVPSPISITAASCTSTIANLGCSFSLPINSITVSMLDSSSLPLDIIVSINLLTAPVYGTSPQFFTFSTFDSSNNLIQFDNSSVIFNNNCSLSCKTCSNSNSSACLSCYNSPSLNLTLLYEQACVSTCPSVSYQSNLTCIACDPLCLTCSTSKTNCQSCNTSNTLAKYFYYNVSSSSGSCLPVCSEGTYLLNTTCNDCPSICSSCNSTAFCFQCQPSYFYYNGTCLPQCPNNTLTNSTNSSCTDCQSPCFSCSNSTSNCLSCVNGMAFYNNSCYSSCPAMNLFILNQTCQQCESVCASCSSVSSNCTSCSVVSNSSHYYNGTCLDSCPELYYSNASTLVCSLCSSLAIGCENCSSETVCLSCDTSYFYLPSNQSCMNSTPPGYFNINGTLYTCNTSCNTCNSSFSNCTSCGGNLNLYQNECISSCPLNLTVSMNNTCMYCSYPCSTCINSTTNCLSCSANSSLYYNSASNSCVNSSACPNSTFSDNSTLSCINCNSSCAICSGTNINCSQCSPNYYLISDNNTCSQICPDGTFAVNTTSGVCSPCSYPCSTCLGTTNYCLSCSQANSTLFLSNGSCVSNASCSVGTFANIDNFTCAFCIQPCSTCVSLEICSTCQTNYSLITLNNTCSTICPSGYAPASVNGTSVCTLCNYPCTTCSSDVNNCSSCASNSSLYLQGNACVNQSACNVGTYANLTNNKCDSCQSSCSSCSSLQNCTLCSSSYYLDLTTNLCVSSSSCQNGTVSGYNSSSGRNQCLTCSNPCLTCSNNVSECTSCLQTNSSLYLLNSSCVNSSVCPNGTYADQATFTCHACPSTCLTCINGSVCISCIVDYYLSSQKCLSLCPNGTYVVNASGVISCLSCNSSCTTCHFDAFKCTSCSNNTYLYNQTCLNSTLCPSGTYANSTSNICTSCSSPCLSCLNQSSCLSCSGNGSVLLLNGTCSSSSCPNGTILMNISGVNTCSLCSSECLTCSNTISSCTSCSNSSNYLYNGTCYDSSSCPNGTFPNSFNNTCQKCSSPCLFCSNNTVCQSCLPNYYLINSTCSTVCPNGTLTVNQSSLGLCQACMSPCLTCINSLWNCTSCANINGSQSFFYNNSCYNSSECPDKTYQNNQTSTCSSCISPCGSCTSLTSCLSCSNGLYLNLNDTCLSTCSNGTVAQNISSGGICLLCTYPCNLCSKSPTNCSSCSQVNLTLYLSNGTCVSNSSCINGTYANGTTLKCQACLSVCSSCGTYSDCNGCKSGYYLNGSTCISSCPNGTAAINSSSGGICQTCSYPCTLCSNSTSNCLSCSQVNSTLYLSNGSCVSTGSCLNGTYQNITTLKCESCKTSCSSCTSYSTCTGCALGYFQDGSSCLAVCPNGTVGDNNTRTCVNCLPPCNFCTVNQTNCLSCLSPYLYYSLNNSCLTLCPDGYYANVTSLLCSLCVSPCSFCSSKVSCLSCASGFYYYNGSCLKTCPNGYFKDSPTLNCSICINNCSTCSGLNTCTSCSSPFLLSNNSCTTSCPSPAIYNTSNVCSTCAQAIPHCLGCNSTELKATCLICATDYILTGGICVSNSYGLDNTLSNSLRTSTIFPLPFTITGGLLFIACFMSKFQNKNSYVVGIAYSLFGFIESSCLIYTIIVYNIYVVANSPLLDYQIYLQIGLIIIAALNIFGLIVQTYQLNYDDKFGKWLRSKCNKCCYFIIALFSCLINYKFKMIIFTKLFSFYCLRAQLDSVQKFRIFNVVSFLGVGHEGLIIYISAIIMATLASQQQLFLSFLDLILVNTLNIILALAVSNKEETFFEQEQDDGIRINKVFNIYDEEYDVNIGDTDKKGKLKENQGIESRDMMVGDDEDDQFTLSISDRQSSNSNINDDNITPNNSSLLKKNKSAIIESENNDSPETGNSLKKNRALNLQSNNFSAVYQGDLSRAKRKQFQQSHKLSKQIVDKSKHSGIQQQNEQSQKDVNKQENIFDVGDQIYQQGQIEQMKQKDQEAKNQQKLKQKGNELEDIDENQFDDFQTGALNPIQVMVKQNKPSQQQAIESLRYNKDGNRFNPSSSSASGIPSVRQIKVYKGRQIQSQDPQDIQEIDLTINKKQRQLIELRKSIRQKERDRERSQDRKSRKNRSKSRDKNSKDAMSDFGIFPPRSRQLSSKGSQQEPVYSRLQIIQKPMQSSSIVVDDRLLAPVTMNKQQSQQIDINDDLTKSKFFDNEEKPDNTEKQEQVRAQISIIDETNETKYEKQSLVRQIEPIEQQNHLEHSSQQKNIKVNFHQIDKQYNENRYQISPRGHQNDQIEEINYQEFKEPMSQQRRLQPDSENIFEYKEFDNSYIMEEQPSSAQNRNALLKKKPIGFLTKPHKKIQDDDFNQFQGNQNNLNFQMAPDSQNNPLDNKLKHLKKQSIYSGNKSAKGDEDGFDDVNKTSRNQISKNRSHLVRQTNDQRQRSLGKPTNMLNQAVQGFNIPQNRLFYNQMNDNSTFRQSSDKQFTERKFTMNRPPLQNQRPSTTQKKRIYGTNQVQEGRSSIEQQSLKNPGGKTSMDMRGYKSKQLGREEGFQMYGPSFTSNQKQFDSQELIRQPNKPTISRVARIRQGDQQQEEGSLRDSFTKKSMKSYKSRSIDREEYQQSSKNSNSRKELKIGQESGLQQYYKKSLESPSNRSRKSKSKSKIRSSQKRDRQIEKIYLQRLEVKK